jgi:hypothetical protein
MTLPPVAARLTLVILVVLATACATVPARGTTPLLEATAGVNLQQLPQAEFPGLTASVVVNRASTSRVGVAIVGDGELSYLQFGVTAGPRVYGRTGPLFGEHRVVSAFGQLLVGGVAGATEGVMRSQGGVAVQPGIGFDYGAGAGGFHMQFDYRKIRDGFVEDSRVAGARTDLSGPRLIFGMVWRFLPR